MKISNKKKKGCGLWVKFGGNYAHVVLKGKETDIINRFSHILHGECILKQEVVVLQTPEWKFQANIARTATLQGH